MLIIPRIIVNAPHPICSHHFVSRFSLRSSHKPFLNSKHFSRYYFETPPMPPSSSSQFVAEYAKSNRSSCKKCSKSIESKALRFGLVTRDNRGFDMTKWYHLDCFPIEAKLVASPEDIKGFSTLKVRHIILTGKFSLESSDQEDLKKLLAEQDKAQENHKRTKEIESEVEESDPKKIKHPFRGSDQEDPKKLLAGQDKAQKLGTSDMEPRVDVNFSLSDVKNKYKDATLLPKWKAFQTVIFLGQDDGLHDSSKIAAFDFDGCLAKTAVKKVGADAWSLMYPSIPDKLQSLYNDGYKLVIFTNESNIERWKNKRQVAVDSKVGRLDNFIKKVKVPIQVFIACGLGKSGKAGSDDPFRKPNPGMWLLMEKHFNSGIAIDMDQSFYVGDAAGRENDHSDADIKFAEAIGLKFYVPEEYFDTKG